MQLSSTNQELVRTRPQSTTLNLVLFQPRIVMQAKVNNISAARGDRNIPFDTVSFGSSSAVESGMTLLIGTLPSSDNVGRIRIRSGTASNFSVSENSNIAWADNLDLTVLRQWDLWPIFPRIIQDPSNAEEVIFYKDYDIPYTNQNSVLGTFVCAGPHRPVLIENGTGRSYYSSTGTYNLLGHALTYDWAFEGGSPSGSTSADPGWVSYTVPGDYVTRLIVTDNVNGAKDTTYRYVSVRNKIGEGSNTPAVRWTMDELSGSRPEGGHSVQFTIYDTVTIDDNAVVMLHSDDYYGTVHQSLGGNYPSGSSIFFVGYIEKDSIHYDFEKSFVRFTASSLTNLMKQTLGFAIETQSTTSPTKWFELLNQDVRRAIYHYLKWHTTVLSIADFEFKGTDYPIQYFDSDRESMFDSIDNLMRGTLAGSLVSDRQGKLWAEVSAAAYPNPTGSFPSLYDISKRDWRNQPAIEEKVTDDFSYLEMGGIQYSGSTGTFAALIGCAPGAAPSFRGRVEKSQGLALGSQSQLNQMVGNLFANRNSRYPTIQLDMTANFRNLDIAPQESNRITVDAEDNLNSNTPLDLLFIPDTVSWQYNAEKHLMLPRIGFKNLLTGNAGETIPVPNIDDIKNGFNVPPINIPNIPLFTIPSVAGSVMVWQAQGACPQGVVPLTTVNFNQGNHVTFSPGTGSYTVTLNNTGVYEVQALISSSMAGAGGRVIIGIQISGGAIGYSRYEAILAIGNNIHVNDQTKHYYLPAGSTVVFDYADNSGGSIIITTTLIATIKYYPPL